MFIFVNSLSGYCPVINVVVVYVLVDSVVNIDAVALLNPFFHNKSCLQSAVGRPQILSVEQSLRKKCLRRRTR